MGICFSCKTSPPLSASSSLSAPPLSKTTRSSNNSSNGGSSRKSSNNGGGSYKFSNKIRVVHLDGSLEEFEDPITVAQVTANHTIKHFMFAQAQFLSLDSKPLDSDAQLQLGSIYFLLPLTVFQTELSPIDLATLSRRLTVVANRSSSAPAPISDKDSSNPPPLKKNKSTKKGSLPSTTKNRFADRYVANPVRFSETYVSTTSPNPSPSPSPNHRRFSPATEGFGGNYYKSSYYNNNNNSQQLASGDQSPCWKPILESITERSFNLSTESEPHLEATITHVIKTA